MENIHYNTYEQATNILLSGKHIEFTMSVPNVRDGHFAQKLEMLSKCPFSLSNECKMSLLPYNFS